MKKFTLRPPDIRLHFDNDALPGGLDAWGDGELEVVVDGAVSLGEFFDITERMASIPEGDAASKMQDVRDTMSDFGARIKEWSIDGWEAGAEGYMKLPYPLALAIFTAWQRSAQPGPTSSEASANGASPQAVLEVTAA